MDVKTRTTPPSPDERAAIESVLGPPTGSVAERTLSGGQRNRDRRWLLLPTLHAVNDRVGWISQAAIDHIAVRLDLGPAEVYGVASFYSLFSLTERPTRQVHVCTDLACRAADPDVKTSPVEGAHSSACLGLCERAPAALVIESGEQPVQKIAAPVTPTDVEHLIAGRAPPDEPSPATYAYPDADSVLLRRVGMADPLDLDAFTADDGFAALRRARSLTPQQIIDAVSTSGLIGRGGAGFPTGRKWQAVLDEENHPHYLVCNADESEPGTFKDRTLIENDPYTLLESIAIAMLATETEIAYIYLRGEYPRAWVTLTTALERIADHPLFSGLSIMVFKGAGAYICGEETAIFNSIEGHRGEPRNKPPFPFQVGLFGQPTTVNNVETLMNVAPILRSIDATGGTGDYRADRRLFCLSGAVKQPGVYEVQLGLTLGDLIERAGGMRRGAHLQAVLLGGAAGGFAAPADLDVVLDHQAVLDAGLTLGSGVVMVLDDTVDLIDHLTQIAAFFRDESCGQCVPCRVGTVRQHEAIQRLAAGITATDVGLLNDIGRAMTDASICGLGQTAFAAIDSAMTRLGVFSDE